MTRHLSTITVVIALFATVCLGGIRSEGKYSGVVIFDRWDGCTLYSSIYVMYLSQAVKEQLRPEAGKCVQIDATEVYQPINPGDGLIKKLTLLGRAPAAKAWESPEGLKLTVARAFKNGDAPQFTIRAENVSDKPKTLHMNCLAPTLLAAKNNADFLRWSPSDGPSTAVVTRNSFWIDGPRMQGGNETWQWKIIAPKKLEKDISLAPKAAFELRLSFKVVPPGEYEFLAGYGGEVHEGQCIASNLIAFDVKQDGKAVIVKPTGG